MRNHVRKNNDATSPSLDLCHATLSELETGLEQGLFTSKSLVATYKARIVEVNHECNAVIETTSEAIANAHLLDLERRIRGSRGSLHGIPILLKDNIPTLDDTDTACGSLALVGARPLQEAAIVTVLRAAGAVVLGKANMAEWSGFRSTSGCSGWSARGGQTRGIFYPNMKASGSSSGSAVAVALGLCFAALGTETCYSVVSPAEKSGIIGFKPTRELISSEGIIHASKRLDTVGLLTRNIADTVKFLLELIYYSDHIELSTKLKLIGDIRPSCSKLALAGVHVGIPSHLSEFQTLHNAKLESFKSVLIVLQQAGATLVQNVDISGAKEYEALSVYEKQAILDTDMKLAINDYFSRLATNPNNIYNLQDLVDSTKSCPQEEFPQRNVEGLERAQATDPASMAYRNMLVKDAYFAGEGGIPGALTRHRCDVLLLPTLSVTLQTFAAKGGSPVMSVPIGIYPPGTGVQRDAKNGLIDVAPGIPFSVYIFGRATRDEDVLSVGHVLEQLTRVRERLCPYIMPEIGLENVVGNDG